MSAYKTTITSFDDDYYYGVFYREDESGRKHHIFNFDLDLDDDHAHSASIYTNGISFVPAQVYADFEIDYLDSDKLIDLQQAIVDRLDEKRREIFQVVKKHGSFATYDIRDSGMM